MLSAAGLGGKKLLASADPFSALEVASFSVPPDEYFRVGMRAFPPSLAVSRFQGTVARSELP